jgi:hypothetical protein
LAAAQKKSLLVIVQLHRFCIDSWQAPSPAQPPLPTNLHPGAYFLEIHPVALLLHAAVLFGCSRRRIEGHSARGDEQCKSQKTAHDSFLPKTIKRLFKSSLRTGLQRNADCGAALAIVEAALRPGAIEGAGGVRQYAFPVRLAIQESAIVASAANARRA